MASSERAGPAAAETVTAAEDKTLRIVRTFEAPIGMVFEAWTVPEQIVQWWGPEGCHIPEYRIDMREGGAWRTVMRGDSGDNIVSGVIQEISPPHRLVFSWAWETDGVRGHETVVTIDLRALGEDRTELSLTQREFETVDSCEQHSFGWNSSFDCLDTYLGEE